MKYQIDIKGMHCGSCEALIKMSLEENNLTNINVSIQKTQAVFETTEDTPGVVQILNKAFAELAMYKYLNLTKL